MSSISLFGSGATEPSNSALSKDEQRLQEKRLAGPWLNAWQDPMANLKAFSSCMRLCDVHADGQSRLLVADSDRKLKVFKGTSLSSEHALLDVPQAMACFYDNQNKPLIPCVAVAAGPFVFIHRGLRPYYKFPLPKQDINVQDKEAWENMKTLSRVDSTNANTLHELLSALRKKGTQLSSRSKDFLDILSTDMQIQFIERHKFIAHDSLTVATCMETIQNMQESYNDTAVSQLIIGTESGYLYVLNTLGTDVVLKLQLPAVPVCMAAIGAFEKDYRIVVACRNGNVYTVKKNKIIGNVIECETQPLSLCIVEKNIIVACMDNVVHSYHFKGKKNYTLYLPSHVTNIAPMRLRTKNIEVVLVALSNGEVRIYNKRQLVNSLKTDAVVTGMHFGPYGREENALVIAFKSGGLVIKMLQRQANFDVSSVAPGPPPEQDIPLNVPKKTKLFVQQTQREVEQAVEMHQVFQRDLCKLRLATARAYVKVITNGQGPLSAIGGTQLRLDAKVVGLGPSFKLKIDLKNTGPRPLHDLSAMVTYNSLIYQVKQSTMFLPALIPNVSYLYEVEVESVEPSGAADSVRVFVSQQGSSVPVLSAIVSMPMSETLEKDD